MSHHVVLIDNYDSFTFNLAQLFAGLRPLRSVQVTVVRNDAIDVAGLRALAPTHIVLSPGPGIPERRRDFGVCGDVLREALRKSGRLPRPPMDDGTSDGE